MATNVAATGCPEPELEASSNSGGIEPPQAAAAVAACKAADAWANDSHQTAMVDDKSLAWLGLCHALTKAQCLASPTATPISEPSLSEVSSSHGGLSPRGSPQLHCIATQRASPLRWADEIEEEFLLDGAGFECDEPAEELEEGTGPATPSKRSRRSNRRRRARAEKAAASAYGGLLLGNTSPGAHKDSRDGHMATPNSATGGRSNGIRNSVTVGDLLCMSPSQARYGRSPTAAMPEEVGWFAPASPCQFRPGPSGGIMSTSPCGANAGHLGFGYDAYMTGSPQSGMGGCVQPFFTAPMSNEMWGCMSPTAAASPCRAHSSAAGLFSTSPQIAPVGMEASSRTPLALPVGPVGGSTTPGTAPMASGVISTLPTGGVQAANFYAASAASPTQGGLPLLPSMGNEASAVDPAGSPNADALRSWLHANGLPSASCADLAYQLQAVAPETYED